MSISSSNQFLRRLVKVATSTPYTSACDSSFIAAHLWTGSNLFESFLLSQSKLESTSICPVPITSLRHYTTLSDLSQGIKMSQYKAFEVEKVIDKIDKTTENNENFLLQYDIIALFR